MGGWSGFNRTLKVDDTGLRNAGGTLQTDIGVPFLTPPGKAPNCLLLSYFKPYSSSISVPLSGKASGIYLLVTGTTHPQFSRVQNALAKVAYTDGSSTLLPMRNPETWWPIDQDYMIDDYMFSNTAPLPPRVDLATGLTRLLDPVALKGKGGHDIAGGAATILHLALNPAKIVASLTFEVSLYPMVGALIAATLVRPT